MVLVGLVNPVDDLLDAQIVEPVIIELFMQSGVMELDFICPGEDAAGDAEHKDEETKAYDSNLPSGIFLQVL